MRLVWVICAVLLMVVMSCGKDEKGGKGYLYKNSVEEDLLNTNTLDDDTEETGEHNPARSWLRFVKRSDKQRQLKKQKKSKRHKNQLPGLRGPRGLPGPAGPPGPPGAVVTKDVLLDEFREMVREAAEVRAQQLLAARCPGCRVKHLNQSTLFATYPWNDELTVIPVVKAGFHSQIKEDVLVLKRDFKELGNYLRPFGDGSFDRGKAFNADVGRFTAPVDGIYQLTTSLHIGIPRSKGKRRISRREYIRVLICINTKCDTNTSLMFISGLESNSKIFTIHVNGILELKAMQFTSVFVHNSSKSSVIVKTGSSFTGVLTGV